MVADLQEALLKNKELEKQIKSLQEKLSVSYTKENGVANLKENYKSAKKQLLEYEKTVKALKTRVSKLVENLKETDAKKLSVEEELESLKEKYSIRETNSSNGNKLLQEKLRNKDSEIKALNEELDKSKNTISSLNKKAASFTKQTESLKEELEEAKKDASIKYSEYSAKLSKEKSITERYKKIAKRAVEKYIGVQATIIGVKPSDITNKLSENYSFDDIDRVCEDLKEYKLNISKLPFNTADGKKVKMAVKESYEPIIPNGRVDDDVDESLLGLAGLV